MPDCRAIKWPVLTVRTEEEGSGIPMEETALASGDFLNYTDLEYERR